MYHRQSNERYSQGANLPMNPYPPPPQPNPHPSIYKSHMDPYSNPLPPLYYDPARNNTYDYLQNNNPPEAYEQPTYPQWREQSEPKGPMPPPMNPSMVPSPIVAPGMGHYESRPMPPPPHGEYQVGKQPGEPYLMSNLHNPPVNVVQRISGIIKSQLRQLQAILSYAEKKTSEQRLKKERSRSRSRERERGLRGHREHREWNCPKCAYLNFDFRDRCKKCNEQKPESLGPVAGERERFGGKSYVPGPDDWRCLKCNNINYARRTECHRCHVPRGK